MSEITDESLFEDGYPEHMRKKILSALKLQELVNEELDSLEGYVEYSDAIIRDKLQSLLDQSQTTLKEEGKMK